MKEMKSKTYYIAGTDKWFEKANRNEFKEEYRNLEKYLDKQQQEIISKDRTIEILRNIISEFINNKR